MAIYVTGAGVTNWFLMGVPDMGLIFNDGTGQPHTAR